MTKTLTINNTEYTTELNNDWAETRKYPKERLVFFYKQLMANGLGIHRGISNEATNNSLEIGTLSYHYEIIDRIALAMINEFAPKSNDPDYFDAVGIWRQMLSLRLVPFNHTEYVRHIKTANRNADAAHEAGFIDDLYYLNLKWRISQELGFECDTPPVMYPDLNEGKVRTRVYNEDRKTTIVFAKIPNVLDKVCLKKVAVILDKLQWQGFHEISKLLPMFVKAKALNFKQRGIIQDVFCRTYSGIDGINLDYIQEKLQKFGYTVE